jgi:hypothetical protein
VLIHDSHGRSISAGRTPIRQALTELAALARPAADPV